MFNTDTDATSQGKSKVCLLSCSVLMQCTVRILQDTLSEALRGDTQFLPKGGADLTRDNTKSTSCRVIASCHPALLFASCSGNKGMFWSHVFRLLFREGKNKIQYDKTKKACVNLIIS